MFHILDMYIRIMIGFQLKTKVRCFLGIGKGIFYESGAYYIPIYELEYGKNKVVVTETDSNDLVSEKEYIINRIASETDEIYQLKDIKEKGELSIIPFQENLKVKDATSVLLTGYIESNCDIASIKWKRYEHKNYNSTEWEVIPKSETNRVFYASEGEAQIIGNYWAIDVLGLMSGDTKIEIIATDISGKQIVQNVFIENSSEDISNKREYTDENYTTDQAITFINDEIVIFFDSNVETIRCKEIIQEIGGKIVSSKSSINMYSVQIDYKFETFEEIRDFCQNLEETYSEISVAGDNRKLGY